MAESIAAPPVVVSVPHFAPWLDDHIPFGKTKDGKPKYLLLQRLGAGEFGEAFFAVEAEGVDLAPPIDFPKISCADIDRRAKKHVVIKRFRNVLPEGCEQLSKEKKEKIMADKQAMFETERQMARQIKSMIGEHQNLLSYAEDDVDDPATGTKAMVFNFCNAGDIRRLVSGCKTASGQNIQFTLFEFLHIASHLTNGLAALHEHNIIHRDLAFRNIFVHCETDGTLMFKIGDFGLCTDISVSKPTEKKKNGVREPAEVDDYTPYDEKTDIYSLGLVLYELLSLVDLSHGTLYALNTNMLAQERLRLAGSLDTLGLPADFVPAIRLVAEMLVDNPAARPSAKQLHAAFTTLLNSIRVADRVFPLLVDMARGTGATSAFDFYGHYFPGFQTEFKVIAYDAMQRRRVSSGDTVEVKLLVNGVEAKMKRDTSVYGYANGTYRVQCKIPAPKEGEVQSVVVTVNGVVVDKPFTPQPFQRISGCSLPGAQLATFDHEGLLYLLNGDTISVYRLEPRLPGHCVAVDTYRIEGLDKAGGFAVARDGRVFISDTSGNAVVVWDPTEKKLEEWSGRDGADVQHAFTEPTGVTVQYYASGDVVFVVDRDQCHVFDTKGKLLDCWAHKSTFFPTSIAFDHLGFICMTTVDRRGRAHSTVDKFLPQYVKDKHTYRLFNCLLDSRRDRLEGYVAKSVATAEDGHVFVALLQDDLPSKLMVFRVRDHVATVDLPSKMHVHGVATFRRYVCVAMDKMTLLYH